ncbi:hepatitis A virus cellular receptor 1 homolog isoform X2 [Bufo gargarizans]|nr:hepatitis A virus cellular receptor 1 homolog isoform X2 [Bufo gargarizans]XP_044133954.1 hepatitis A virus cellular receptor 1 homolog isoform X2 [Bufo gargarizans]
MVTLPCTYSISYGTTTMCWGRGQCPSSKCNNQIIWTDGKTVTWRKSDKYQLMGDIEKGNVTLTITGVTSEDAGSYCCRVEIPGIFNDQKSEINVKIKEESCSLHLYTSSPVNVSWTTTSEGGYYLVQYTVIALLIVLFLLFGILLYRNQYHEKKVNDSSNTVSAISLGTLEAAQAVENVYVKMQ